MGRCRPNPVTHQTTHIAHQQLGGSGAIVPLGAAMAQGALPQSAQDGMAAGPFTAIHMPANPRDAGGKAVGMGKNGHIFNHLAGQQCEITLPPYTNGYQ